MVKTVDAGGREAGYSQMTAPTSAPSRGAPEAPLTTACRAHHARRPASPVRFAELLCSIGVSGMEAASSRVVLG